MFNLKAQPQPLDIISEANLRSCGLALVGGEDKVGDVRLAATLIIMNPTNLTASGSIIEPPLTVGAPPLSAPSFDGEDASSCLELDHQAKALTKPIH